MTSFLYRSNEIGLEKMSFTMLVRLLREVSPGFVSAPDEHISAGDHKHHVTVMKAW